KQSTRLKTLDVRFRRIDKSPAWAEDEHYEGRAILKSPNLARLNFDKVAADPKKQAKPEPHELIICTGKEVWQYRTDLKQIFIYPLNVQDQKHALEEGPLPFLFNLRAADAKKRYQMTVKSQTADSYVVHVKPLLDI